MTVLLPSGQVEDTVAVLDAADEVVDVDGIDVATVVREAVGAVVEDGCESVDVADIADAECDPGEELVYSVSTSPNYNSDIPLL